MNVWHLRNISSVKIVMSDASFPGKNYSTVANHNIQVWSKKYLAYEFNFCKWFFQNCFFSKGRRLPSHHLHIFQTVAFFVLSAKRPGIFIKRFWILRSTDYSAVLLAYFQFSIHFFKTFIEWLLLLKVRDLYI